MKALSCLAKFLGCSPLWQQIRQQHGLTWTTGTEKLDAFARFFDDNKSLDKMIDWLREALSQLTSPYSNFLAFCTLTGMRSNECLMSIKLINDSEHFKTY